MAQKSKPTGFTKGMLSDPDPRYQLPGSYRYAKNIQLINNDGLTFTVENLDGNKKIIDLVEEIGSDVYNHNFGYYGESDEYGTNKHLPFVGNIVGHYSFKNQLLLIICGIMTGSSNGKDWRTQFLILDFDHNGNVLNVEDLKVAYNVGNEYPNLNMDPLILCRTEGLIENDCLTRIYWTDNKNSLRTIQLNSSFLADMSIQELDITPIVDFNNVVLTGQTSGSLLSGVYGYAYKYRSNEGAESGISSISDLYHVTTTSSSSPESYYGSGSQLPTGDGLRLTIKNVDQNYDSIVLYALYYTDLNIPPRILEVGDEPILQLGSNESVTFNHSVTENEIPNGLAEILIPSNTWDVCKDIAIKDNILFAANLRSRQNIVSEKEWNVRVRRRSMTSGSTFSLTTTDPKVKDYYIDGSGNVAEVGSSTDYHKLNLSCARSEHQEAHRYDAQGGSGAQGLNLGASSHNFHSNDLGGCRISFKQVPKVADTKGSRSRISSSGSMAYGSTISIDEGASDVHQMDSDSPDTYKAVFSGIGANKDPQGSGARRGYQRGETYRFGVLVYDKAGNPGNVLWIGDIQMPERHDRYRYRDLSLLGGDSFSSSETPWLDDGLVQDFRSSIDSANSYPKYSNQYLSTDGSGNQRKNSFRPDGGEKYYTFDLGVVFEFRIPLHVREKISAFQVVRAERKEEDRTIVQQGFLQQCIAYGEYASADDRKMTPDDAAYISADNVWQDYDQFLKKRIGINMTHNSLKSFTGDPEVYKDRDGAYKYNEFDASKYFGTYPWGSWIKDNESNSIGWTAHIDPSTHVLYSPDSTFGIRPYSFREGDFLRIESALKLSDEIRWANPVAHLTRFGQTHSYTGHGSSNDGYENGEHYPLSTNKGEFFSTVKESDSDEKAMVASGLWHEYDPYYHVYIGGWASNGGLNGHQYVSNTNGETIAGDVGATANGVEGVTTPANQPSGANQTSPRYSIAANNINHYQNHQVHSGSFHLIGNAKEIGDGEKVSADFFSSWEGIADSGTRYAAVHGGFSNHSLGFGFVATGTTATSTTGNSSTYFNASALNDLSDEYKTTDTVSSLSRGTRGILVSFDRYQNYEDHVVVNTPGNINNNGFVPTPIGRICLSQNYTRNNSNHAYFRRIKQPYSALASIVRYNDNQYGGDTLGSIESTIYIAAGHLHSVNDNEENHYSIVFGGDTFVCLYSHQVTYSPVAEKSVSKWHIFPVETYVNTDMRGGLHLGAGDHEEGWDASFPPYHNDWLYNPVYSQEKNLKRYASVKTGDCDVIDLPYQIAYSQTKISGEGTDAFRTFPLFNFHDVEGSYGELTSIINHKNEIYFTQERSFGNLIVNPRTFLQDDRSGTSIFTGSGETVETHTYISNVYGTRHMHSLVQSEANIYYFDVDNEKIIKYTGENLEVLSDQKGIRDRIKQCLRYGRLKMYDKHENADRVYINDMPLNFAGVHGTFDYKSRNLIYTMLDGIRISREDRQAYPEGDNVYANATNQGLAINPRDGSLTGGFAERYRLNNTLVYNEEMDSFTSFWSVYPPQWIQHNGNTFTTRNRIPFNTWNNDAVEYPTQGQYGSKFFFIGNIEEYEDGVKFGSHQLKDGALELWKWGAGDVKNNFYNQTENEGTSFNSSSEWGSDDGESLIIDPSIIEVSISEAPADNKKFDNAQVIVNAINDGENLMRSDESIFESVDFKTDYSPASSLSLAPDSALAKYREGSLRFPIRGENDKFRQVGTYLTMRLIARTEKKFNIFAITAKYRKSYN